MPCHTSIPAHRRGLLILLLLLSPLAMADNGMDFVLQAVRAEQPPVLDGVLDEACWENAPVAKNFIDDDTDDLAQKQTVARVLYDDEHLYVAFECFDSNTEAIQASIRKYDRAQWVDDHVRLQLDPFHKHRERYIFWANPLGTRQDAKQGLFRRNFSWDCDWRVASKIYADRWIAEMAVPIGEMHFNRGENMTWGINFHRTEKEYSESSHWSYPQNGESPWTPRVFANLEGLDLRNVKVKRDPTVEAYVSGTAGSGDVKTTFSTGADASLRLGPQWVSAFTINPDYGQVEADADTIELRDTERFLPERRAFFREGAEIFQTPLNVYYSRRFVDIDAGAKLTGTGGDWTAGVLDVQGQISRDDILRDGNYLVTRANHNIGENSHVGMIAVNAQRDDGYNRVVGPDARLYITDTLWWTTQYLYLDDQEEVNAEGEAADDVAIVDTTAGAFITSLVYDQKPWEFEISLVDIEDNFRPDLGYIRRRDIRGTANSVQYNKDILEGPVDAIGAFVEFEYYQNHDEMTTLRDYDVYTWLNLRRNIDFSSWHKEHFHDPYDNRETGAGVEFNSNDVWRSIEINLSTGEFEEVPYNEIGVEKPWKWGDRMTFELEGDYRLEEEESGDDAIWLARLVSEYTFETWGRAKLTVEQTSEDRHNITLIYSREKMSAIDYHFVLNDIELDGERSQGAFFKTVYHF